MGCKGWKNLLLTKNTFNKIILEITYPLKFVSWNLGIFSIRDVSSKLAIWICPIVNKAYNTGIWRNKTKHALLLINNSNWKN